MGWIEAIAVLVDAVAWPSVVLLALWILRAPIEERIRNLRSVKGRNWEAQFEERAKELESRAEEEIGELVRDRGADRGHSGLVDSAWDLVDIHPRTAVLESWLGVEWELRRAIERAGLDVPPFPILRVVQALVEEGLISEKLAALIRQLQRMRNEAVHAPDFELSALAATNYVATAHMMAGALDRVARD